jgi:hypothetical protein
VDDQKNQFSLMNLYLIHLPYIFRGGDWAIEIALKSHLAATVEPLSLSLSLSLLFSSRELQPLL